MSEISLPKTMNMISTDDHHELVLVFMPYLFLCRTADWMLILMVYVYNFKETAIYGVVIHNKGGS